MSINPLNDISNVYLEQVAAIETEFREETHRKVGGGVKKGGGYERGYAAMQKQIEKLDKGEEPATAKRYKEMRKEALDPVGKEDADIDNDGDNDKSDKYLHNRRKAIGKAISNNRRKGVKEGFSNWRQDLSEVMDDDVDSKPIKEKKVNNKVKTSALSGGLKLGEAVEEIGGTLLEMVEIDEVDYIIESVYDQLLTEGYEEDDIEEAIEYALIEATVTYGHDTDKSYQHKKKTGAGQLVRAVGRLARQKLASKVRGAKKSASATVVKGARKVAKGALGVARKIEGGDKTSSSAHTKTRTASTYRGAGAGTKEKVSSGSYTPPTKKKAEKPADPWKGSSTVPQKPKPKPKAEKPADPWEGSATTPSKAKAKPKPNAATKKAAAPKAKAPAAPKAKAPAAPKRKRKSKLDDLLASVRSEQVQIYEKITAKTDMGAAITDFQKSKSPQLAGRTKEQRRKAAIAAVLTARRGGRKLGEQMDNTTPNPSLDKNKQTLDKTKFANLKMLQQKKQQLERQKLQMQKSGKLPLEAD